jgi:heptosyltransferase-2
LLTDAIAVPKPGEIPTHEKFYYLELLRRAKWFPNFADEPFIRLAIPHEYSVAAEEKLRSFGSRSNKLRIAVGAGASYGSAKCWPPERFAATVNSLQDHSETDVILFGTPTESAVNNAIAEKLRHPPVTSPAKPPLPNSPHCSPVARFFSATIPAPCT